MERGREKGRKRERGRNTCEYDLEVSLPLPAQRGPSFLRHTRYTSFVLSLPYLSHSFAFFSFSFKPCPHTHTHTHTHRGGGRRTQKVTSYQFLGMEDIFYFSLTLIPSSPFPPPPLRHLDPPLLPHFTSALHFLNRDGLFNPSHQPCPECLAFYHFASPEEKFAKERILQW